MDASNNVTMELECASPKVSMLLLRKRGENYSNVKWYRGRVLLERNMQNLYAWQYCVTAHVALFNTYSMCAPLWIVRGRG